MLCWLDTRVNPDACGQANSITVRVDVKMNFWISKEKVVGPNLSGNAWTGPEITTLGFELVHKKNYDLNFMCDVLMTIPFGYKKPCLSGDLSVSQFTCGGSNSPDQDWWYSQHYTPKRGRNGKELSFSCRFTCQHALKVRLPRNSTKYLHSKPSKYALET